MNTGATNRSIRTTQLPADDPAQPVPCRQCGAARRADERFCESCGHDQASAVWSIEVGADHDYYVRAGSDLVFPKNRIASVLVFEADHIMIGRRKESRALLPDVDLCGELADPGASHAHATITRDAESGVFTIVDLGSTNGTTLNEDDEAIAPHKPLPVNVGDRVHVGAWTTITFRN
jgi:hypothetical protein